MKGVLHSFSIRNIFYDKMDLRLFYLDVAIYKPSGCKKRLPYYKINPLSTNPTKWSNTLKKIRRQFTDKLFECI